MIMTTMIGNLGADAKVTTMQDGSRAITFSIGSNKKDKDGNKITTWVSATRWVQPNGSYKIADYLLKGCLVYVRGEMNATLFEGKPYLKMRVDEIQLLGAKEKPLEQPITKIDDPFAPIDEVPF